MAVVPATSRATDTFTGAAAGGDLSGTYPNPAVAALAVTNAKVAASAAIVYSKLALTGSVLKADLAASALAALAGAQLDYAEFTATVSVTATTEATANTLVSGNAVTYDGSTPVLIIAYLPIIQADANVRCRLVLYDGAASIGWLSNTFLGNVLTGESFGPMFLARQLTPSAAAHTYSIRSFLSAAGTYTFTAGAGGSGVTMPGFIKIIHA